MTATSASTEIDGEVLRMIGLVSDGAIRVTAAFVERHAAAARQLVALAASDISVAVAIEMGLVARFFERVGDHAVNVTRRPHGDEREARSPDA